jgi:hypothetical protein
VRGDVVDLPQAHLADLVTTILDWDDGRVVLVV